jgi:hypothetical protein
MVSKKQQYFRKRRSALKVKTKKSSSSSSSGGGGGGGRGDLASGDGLAMAAAAAASNDLLALISNSAVPVFSDEPEGPEVVEFQKAGEEDSEDSGSNDVTWGFCWYLENCCLCSDQTTCFEAIVSTFVGVVCLGEEKR